MIRRSITDTVRSRLDNFPAVALLGPRQAGKTDVDRLIKAADMIGAGKKVLISRTDQDIAGAKAWSTNLRGILDNLLSR